MELKRKTFQGVSNIVRFNWPFYVVTSGMLLILLIYHKYLPQNFQLIVFLLCIAGTTGILASLLTSWYVYDHSSLYQLNNLPNLNHQKVLNISAGFDETTNILKTKFPEANIIPCDFYKAEKHTEASLKRARKIYPAPSGTVLVRTEQLPFDTSSFDTCNAFFSAHEIRSTQERIQFFKELKRITKPKGKIIVTEHLRDLPNALAYTFGVFHFLSKSNWQQTFSKANLKLAYELKTTPFVSTFILETHGT